MPFNRRSLLTSLLLAGNGLLAGLVGIPALLHVLAPAWRSRRIVQWQSLKPLDQLPIGSMQKVAFQIKRDDWSKALTERSVYIWRPTDNQIVVYSRNCTDLSCPVHFDVGSECFLCPCHGGIFAKDGTPLAGPPKIPLYRYQSRIKDGRIEIDLDSLPLMT